MRSCPDLSGWAGTSTSVQITGKPRETGQHTGNENKRQRLECCGHKPRNAGSHKKLGKSSNGIFPRVSGERSWLMPCFGLWNFGLLGENIFLLFFEPPVWC